MMMKKYQDFPHKHLVIFHSYVKLPELPEGKHQLQIAAFLLLLSSIVRERTGEL